MASESEIVQEVFKDVTNNSIDWKKRSEFYKDQLKAKSQEIKRLKNEKNNLIYKANYQAGFKTSIAPTGKYCEVCPNELSEKELINKVCNRCNSIQS